MIVPDDFNLVFGQEKGPRHYLTAKATMERAGVAWKTCVLETSVRTDLPGAPKQILVSGTNHDGEIFDWADLDL